ncbi:MAG TPA: M23 family metallopeptidase [Candidatus Aminicenantes bacterium]|nr:M23 family metallopeptidase [Candidatus Aminicenantes bacterium]
MKGKIFGIPVAVLLACVPLCARGEAAPEDRSFGDISIRYLAAGKKVIPSVTCIDDLNTVDIKLPDIVVENRGKKPVVIQDVEAIGKDGQDVVVTTRIRTEELSNSIRKSADAFAGKPYMPGLQLASGDIVIPGRITGSLKIDKGESAILLLSRMAFLHYVGHAEINSMELDVKILIGKKSKRLKYPVHLTHYESRGKYVFPLKGDLHMALVPLSYFHHRVFHSQEFAFDVVGANQKGAGFTEISASDPKRLSDFGIWGRDIFAIGDGTVVEAGDRFPESIMSDPALFSDGGYTQKVMMDQIGKIGFINAVAGNFIIIDHHNGEFSAYCHVQEGSMKVKSGEKVKKGQAIGRVGNTGNSSAPHLHFQLMDSKNFVTANGLPIMFENIGTDPMVIECPVTTNNLSFSDSIYFTVKSPVPGHP